MSDNESEYNIYNHFDPYFINYGEIYKSPQEMKMNSKYLIDDYAEALMKGKSRVVPPDNPDLVGNRYFIDTQTQCLDKNDDTKKHNLSLLVDNINSSAMKTAKNGDSGLIYSLLASLKTLNSESMFADMSNNVPTEYKRMYSTDYLKNIDAETLPICIEAKVYPTDKEEEVITGWVREGDYENIDPVALKEGYINAGATLDADNATGAPLEDGWASAKNTETAMNAQSDAVSEEASAQQEKTMQAANSAKEKGPKQAGKAQGSVSSSTKASMKSQTESASKSFNAAKQRGLGDQLKEDTKAFLKKEEDTSTIDLLNEFINMRYECKDGGNIRIPSLCVKGIYNSHKDDQVHKSKDAERTDLCEGQNFQSFSMKDIFDKIINAINRDKSGSGTLSVPGIPNKEICVWGYQGKDSIFGLFRRLRVKQQIDSADYKTFTSQLEKYRDKIAENIVRYKKVGFYGHCPEVKEQEGFTTIEKSSYGIQFTAYIYMISLLFIFVYMLYRFMHRFFQFDLLLKKKTLSKK